MDLLLAPEGRILDVGCGFGLFAAYFEQTQPEPGYIVGVDPDERRVGIARRGGGSSSRPRRAAFVRRRTCGSAPLEGGFDAAYVLDVMHHLPSADQARVLERLRSLLVPGGMLLVKDITTEPRFDFLLARSCSTG